MPKRKRISGAVLVQALNCCDGLGYRFGQFVLNVIREHLVQARIFYPGITESQKSLLIDANLFNVENPELEEWIISFIKKSEIQMVLKHEEAAEPVTVRKLELTAGPFRGPKSGLPIARRDDSALINLREQIRLLNNGIRSVQYKDSKTERIWTEAADLILDLYNRSSAMLDDLYNSSRANQPSCCEREVAKCATWLFRQGYADAAEKLRRSYPTPGDSQ